jgi:hypothetical protein
MDLVRDLAQVDGAELSDADRIDAITALERLKSAASAAQARVTVAFDRSQRSEAKTRAEDLLLRRSVSAQVALARRESPVTGSRHVGVARALVVEMPHTMAALTRGDTSEWRATLVVRETATLTRADRTTVDAELAQRLPGLGNRQLAAEARKLGYRLDPTSLLRRTRGAETDRRVSLRPAPDTMTYLTGFLPVAQGVAVHAALRRQADSLRSGGDGRSLGQLMADTLVARVTGREQATGTPVELRLVATDETVLGGGDEPGHVPGYGPVPATLVRRLVREADRAWVRRLVANPRTGALVSMESRRRLFRGRLRDLLVTRDDVCRTSWCDAPIRHVDHPEPVAAGGATVAANSQGLCEACNYAKEAPRWRSEGVGAAVVTRSPTGRHYSSRPPPMPGRRAASPPGTSAGLPPGRLEPHLHDLLIEFNAA